MTSRRAALTAAHVAAALFGLSGIFGALISTNATIITCGRALFACAALMAVAALRKSPLLRGLDRHKAIMLCMTGLLLAAHWVSFFIAVKTGGVSVATLGFASFPAFIALLDMLVFRERIRPQEQILLGLVTLGLILVTPSFDTTNQGTSGLVWGVLSGLSFAILAVISRRSAHGMDALQTSFWQNLVVVVVVAPFATSSAALLAPMDWIYLLLLGVFCTGLSQTLFVKSLESLQARSVGMIIALEPVYAIVCAWWLFGEQPSLRMLGGGVLIMGAIFLAARTEIPKANN